MKTIIQFVLVTRRGRRVIKTEPCWLATCSFADGPGMKVKRMTTTRDFAKAMRWSRASAYEIAVQFSHLPATLVREDGTVLEDETTKLQAEQLARHVELRRRRVEMDAEFQRVFAPVYEMLKSIANR